MTPISRTLREPVAGQRVAVDVVDGEVGLDGPQRHRMARAGLAPMPLAVIATGEDLTFAVRSSTR